MTGPATALSNVEPRASKMADLHAAMQNKRQQQNATVYTCGRTVDLLAAIFDCFWAKLMLSLQPVAPRRELPKWDDSEGERRVNHLISRVCKDLNLKESSKEEPSTSSRHFSDLRRKRTTFPNKNSETWDFAPKVDAAVAIRTTLPVNNVESFKDQMDKKMDFNLSKAYDASGTYFHPSVALTSVARALKISYGATDPLLSDRALYPFFFRTVQDDRTRYAVILKFLQHFGWNWVGIITSKDESGERELQELSHEMTSHGICIEFIVKMSSIQKENDKDLAVIRKSTTQVLITCGTCSAPCFLIFQNSESVLQNITIIVKASWTYVLYFNIKSGKTFNGSLSIAPPTNPIPGVNTLIHKFHPSNRPNDPLLEDIWLMNLNCLSPNLEKNNFFQYLYKFTANNCTGKERIQDKISVPQNPVYNAVYILAHTLHNMHSSLASLYPEIDLLSYKYLNLLHHYVRRVHYTDLSGQKIFFNERGEVPSKYFLLNIKVIDNKKSFKIIQYDVGVLDMSLANDQPLHIKQDKILWKNGKIPRARCNDFCPAGTRKAPNGGYHSCCYACVSCSEGEISKKTDSNCQKCPDNEWPDERKAKCISKTNEFLSYEKEIMGPLFSSISILCSVITIQILGIFICFRDTPIVRANNCILSFLLLVAIMLSFLCVFLFLGRPVDITCILRQVSFGIIFSVAVSSILAKTVMVCIAFKATKPGSFWRKCAGMGVSNCIVLICSSIQVLINVIWLSISPPFLEFDMISYPGKIIIQCNEGSVIAFYLVLGYLGILAAVSFVLAFMVRTLPDSFNEAKYITFSMLVFCSVWIAMIPAYLSTRGKYMVAVEIFAILASSAGILGCIFFPKCYILVIRPETNTRKHIFGKK
ncbi:vomeronasal type-2 receptor 26-like [Pelobates fuscus]|uniref:vomeronasal type-2 receptor 26-like n=1 Tax=Pelobates fuscus TaxID=191477 RepID=UPI002FE4A2DF